MSIKIKLKPIRLQKGLSQTTLARLSGVKQNYISEIENGTKNGSIQTLNKLAIALNVRLDALVDERGDADEK